MGEKEAYTFCITMNQKIFWYTIPLLALVLYTFVVTHNDVEAPVGCTMEAMICPDGSAVGRSGPNCEFTPCPTIPVSTEDIRISYPTLNETVSSPLTVQGQARGSWFFEGSFPVVVTNWDGLIIGEGYVTAQEEWMTAEFVPFTGTISFTFATDTPYTNGTVIFKKDNPSGLPENDKAIEIPVTFAE